MKTLITPCLIALIATLTVVGTNQAANTSVDKWFRIVDETTLMINTANADLIDVETMAVHLDAVVDHLYLSYKKGVDPEYIQMGLDSASGKLAITTVRFEDCRDELRTCGGMLDVALHEGQRLESEGVAGATDLVLEIKYCCNKLNAVESRCTPCQTDLLVLRDRIEDLHALLLIP